MSNYHDLDDPYVKEYYDQCAKDYKEEQEREARNKPKSPCVNICKLDKDTICIGCGRSIEEIISNNTSGK